MSSPIFTPTSWTVADTPNDIIQAAYYELNYLQAGETPNADDAAWGLQKLQRLIDSWNAQRDKIFAQSFTVYTLPILSPLPNGDYAPITIGPGGQFNTPLRPVRLVAASLILASGNSNIDLGINVQDADWWAAQTIKNLTSSITTDVYYEPTNPLGSLNFWPVSTVANQVRLQTWTALNQPVNGLTSLALAPGYWDALVNTLAVQLAPSCGKNVTPELHNNQALSVKAITQNNNQAPKMATDMGLPRPRPVGRPDFNFLNGKPW